jgi:hypothetical protein
MTCTSSVGRIQAGETGPIVRAALAREAATCIEVTYNTKSGAFGVGALIGLGILVVLCAVTITGDDENTKNVGHVGIGSRGGSRNWRGVLLFCCNNWNSRP